MAIPTLQLLSLPVTDQAPARASHVDVTWFETMRPGPTEGPVLESGDLDGRVDRLREKGVGIEGEVEDAPRGRYVTFDEDDGNGLVIRETAGPTTR